jgi:hypothetical protein
MNAVPWGREKLFQRREPRCCHAKKRWCEAVAGNGKPAEQSLVCGCFHSPVRSPSRLFITCVSNAGCVRHRADASKCSAAVSAASAGGVSPRPAACHDGKNANAARDWLPRFDFQNRQRIRRKLTREIRPQTIRLLRARHNLLRLLQRVRVIQRIRRQHHRFAR